jgi:hypothetical protein
VITLAAFTVAAVGVAALVLLDEIERRVHCLAEVLG